MTILVYVQIPLKPHILQTEKMLCTAKAVTKKKWYNTYMIFLYTTVPTKEAAEKLSDESITQSLTACVDFWPIRSKYMWEGQKVDTEQYMMMFTTHSKLATQLEVYIKENHPHNVPMVARTEIDVMNNAYQEWVNSVLNL